MDWGSPWDSREAVSGYQDYAEPATLSYSTLQHRPMAYEEQSFTASAQRLIEEQAGFVKKVEEELRRVGRVLEEHSCFREALQVQLEEQGRAWRREAEELKQRVEQLREQLTKTMEAALWSGSEVAAVRKELTSFNGRSNAGRAPAERAPAWEDRLAAAEERIEQCKKHVVDNNDFFSQAIFEVSGDVAQLHERFGGLEAKVLRLQAESKADLAKPEVLKVPEVPTREEPPMRDEGHLALARQRSERPAGRRLPLRR